MKLLIKIYFSILVFLPQAFCLDHIILISYRNVAKAQLAKSIMEKKFDIPSNFISQRYQSKPCEVQQDSLIQICFTQNGEMKFPLYKRRLVEKTLSTFYGEKI